MKTFKMIGTSGSDFTGVSQTSAGRIGFRQLSAGEFRVRVEPTGKALGLSTQEGWSQPESGSRTNRYSKVVNGAVALAVAIADGQRALDVASVRIVPATAAID